MSVALRGASLRQMSAAVLTKKERNRVIRETGRYEMSPSATCIPRAFFKHNIWLAAVDLGRADHIGTEAFLDCVTLKTIDLSGVVCIGEKAFAECRHLRRIDLPADLHILRSGAFQTCTRLKKVVFERDCRLRSLSENVFADCESLETVVFPREVREIKSGAFSRCKSLKAPELPLRLRSIGPRAFYSCGFDEIELPEGLVEIGESAFLKCRNLRYVYVPDTVRRIGKWAFHGCDRLEVLEINHDPEEIGPWVTNRSCTIRCPRGSRMEASALEFGMRVEHL